MIPAIRLIQTTTGMFGGIDSHVAIVFDTDDSASIYSLVPSSKDDSWMLLWLADVVVTYNNKLGFFGWI